MKDKPIGYCLLLSFLFLFTVACGDDKAPKGAKTPEKPTAPQSKEIVNSMGMKFVYISPGKFNMG